jgi:hypothetical protein
VPEAELSPRARRAVVAVRCALYAVAGLAVLLLIGSRTGDSPEMPLVGTTSHATQISIELDGGGNGDAAVDTWTLDARLGEDRAEGVITFVREIDAAREPDYRCASGPVRFTAQR